MRAREVVRGWKRLPAGVVGRLLSYGRKPEWAAGDNADKRTWLSAELSRNRGAVLIHASRW